MDQDIAIAMGQALAVLASALQARGALDAPEFARLLGLLAVVATETSEPQGAYLGVWAGMVGNICA